MTKGWDLIWGLGIAEGPKLMFMAPIITGDCVYDWAMLVSKDHIATGAMPIWVVYKAAIGHGDNLAWVTAENHVWVHGPDIAGFCVDAPGPCCYQWPHGCPVSGP